MKGTFINGWLSISVAVLLLNLAAAETNLAASLQPGDILVLDKASSSVVKVDPGSGTQTLIQPRNFTTPKGDMALAPNGDFIMIEPGSPAGQASVVRLDPVTFDKTVITSGYHLQNPGGLVVLPSGKILVADHTWSSPRIVAVDPDSGSQTVLSSGGSLFYPEDMALGPGGSIYVLDFPRVLQIDPNTGSQTIVFTFSGTYNRSPEALAVEAGGTLLVHLPSITISGIHYAAQLIRIPATGSETVLATLPDGHAGDLAVLKDGQIAIPRPSGVVFVDPVTGTQDYVSLYEYGVLSVSRIAVDSAGDLLISNLDAGLLRMTHPAHEVRFLPNTGRTSEPTELLLTPSGNLYLFSPRIKLDPYSFQPGWVTKLDPASGFCTPVVGNVVAPSRAAFVANGRILYFDPGYSPGPIPLQSHPLVQLDPATGRRSPGWVPPEVKAPCGLGAGPEGTFFIGDSLMSEPEAPNLSKILRCSGLSPRVVRVNTAGQVLGLTASGVSVLDLAAGFGSTSLINNPAWTLKNLVIAPGGDLFVVDDRFSLEGTMAVIRINPTTGAATPVSDGGYISYLSGIAVEANGNILVTDSNTKQVIRINPTTGAQSILSNLDGVMQPWGIAVEANGKVLVVGSVTASGPGQVLRIDPATGTPVVLSSGNYLYGPSDVIVGPGGAIFVLEGSTSGTSGPSILQIDPATGAQTVIAQGGLLAGAMSVALDNLGDFLLASGRVVKVERATGAQTTVWHNYSILAMSMWDPPSAVATTTSGQVLGVNKCCLFPLDLTARMGVGNSIAGDLAWRLKDLAIAPSGDVFAVDDRFSLEGTMAVIRINPTTGAATLVSKGGYITYLSGIAVEASGSILVTDWNTNKVIRIDSTTGAQSILFNLDGVMQPSGIAVEADGKVLVVGSETAFGPGKVVRIDPVTGTSAVLSLGEYLYGPSNVIVGSGGAIFVFEGNTSGSSGPSVLQIDPATGAQAVIAQGGLVAGTLSMAVGTGGDLLLLTGRGLVRIEPATGTSELIWVPDFAYPSAIEATPGGDILVGDTLLGLVLRIDSSTGKGQLLTWFDNLIDISLTPSGDIIALTGLVKEGDLVQPPAVVRVDPFTGAQTLIASLSGVQEPVAVACFVGTGTAPTITCPGSALLPCSGPGGFTLPLTVNVADADGDALTVTWTVDGNAAQTDDVPAGGPPTGAQVTLTYTFLPGMHTVKAAVSDWAGTAACQLTIEVQQDTVPPVLSVPGPVVVNATRPSGAVVPDALLGSASATDDCARATVTRSGVPAGNLFPIGNTTVTYKATDGVGNVSVGKQVVTVKGAAAQIADLGMKVRTQKLPQGTANSLLAELNAAQSAVLTGNNRAAQGVMTAFINHVRALSGKQLTSAQAQELISEAERIKAVLGYA